MKTKSLLRAAILTALPALFFSITAIVIAGGILNNAKPEAPDRQTEGIYRQIASIADDLKRIPKVDVEREHADVREIMIRFQLSQVKNPIIILGDSNTEATIFPSLVCGFPLVNGGIGGATVGQFVRLIDTLLAGTSPTAIIIALGTNNVQKAATNLSSFAFQYEAILNMAKRISPIVIAATIPDVRPGHPLVDRFFDADRVVQFNKDIRKIAKSSLVDLNEPLSHSDMTVDGVHFTGEGYHLISETMVKGISTLLCPTNANAARPVAQ